MSKYIPPLEHSIMKHTLVAYINGHSILVSTPRNEDIPFPEWVKVYINIKTKRIAMQECPETDPDRVKAGTFIDTENHYVLKKVECAAVMVMVRKIMYWDIKEKFRIEYKYFPHAGLYMIDLKEARPISE